MKKVGILFGMEDTFPWEFINKVNELGKGEIVGLEGVGADKKAEIRFDVGGLKKLLLRFAKLNVIG